MNGTLVYVNQCVNKVLMLINLCQLVLNTDYTANESGCSAVFNIEIP